MEERVSSGLDFTREGQVSTSTGILHGTEVDQDGQSIEELQSEAE